ncbi:hypothetical protein [Ruminococcus sp. HUN007]|uniref:hypothetical protein n=1 Tax=Ruminococcus sp. HUN007 TaxID=1514668 RepID=UPI0005D29B1B|nr:hypothetical protein [Ruminococcus sp. HUN007]
MALFKKVSAATLALLISASTISASAAGSGILLTSRIGDADNNGSVNTRDFVAIADYIVNGTGEIYNSDFNFDKKNDAKDIVFLKKILASGELEQFDAFAAYKSMIAAYLSAEKSTVESKVTSQLNDSAERTTTTYFTRNGDKAQIKSANAAVEQDVLVDLTGSEAVIYTKGADDKDVVTKKNKTVSALKEIVVDLIKKAQFDDNDDVVSVNIIDSLLLSDSVTEASFENAYTYEDENYKYIAVPVEDIVSGKEAKNVAGTYMIQLDKQNRPVQIDIVIGTSTSGTSTIVENGYAKFKLGEAVVRDPKTGEIVDPTPTNTTPTAPTTTPTAPTTTPTAPTTTPTVSPSNDPFEQGDPIKDLTVYDMLVNSIKAFADAEYSNFDGETSEELVNGEVKYTNKAKVKGSKAGNDYKFNLTDGELVYDNDTYTYEADGYAVYGGKKATEVYADATVKNGENTLTTGWIKKGTNTSVSDAKSEGLSAARSVYANVMDQIIADKKAELDKQADVDALQALQKQADELQAKADKAQADADAEKKALEDKAEAKKAELQAKIDAATKESDKEDLEAEKKAVEDELTADKNALEAKYNKIKDDLTAEKNALIKDLNKALKLDEANEDMDKIDAAIKEVKATVDQLKKEEKAFEDYKNSAVKTAKEQLDFVFPSKSELQAIVGGKNGAKERINSNSQITTLANDSSKIMLTISANALKDGTEKYLDTVDGEFIYIIEKDTFRPLHAEFRNSQAVATDLNKKATATIETAYIDFEYPEEVKVSVPVNVKDNAVDAVEYIKTNKDFTKFAADVISSKVKIAD